MLRASAEINNTDVDLHLINGESSDGGNVEHANELMDFATAVASRDENELAASREKLLAASSPEVLVDAAAVAANFQRMVRIADSIGIPIDSEGMKRAGPSVEELGLRRFRTAEHTPL